MGQFFLDTAWILDTGLSGSGVHSSSGLLGVPAQLRRRASFGYKSDFGYSFGYRFGYKIFPEQLCFSIDSSVSSLL